LKGGASRNNPPQSALKDIFVDRYFLGKKPTKNRCIAIASKILKPEKVIILKSMCFKFN